MKESLPSTSCFGYGACHSSRQPNWSMGFVELLPLT
ncbi:hypothetical protein LEMLEM_LOCUS15553, partial [Lemmus lemmus]